MGLSLGQDKPRALKSKPRPKLQYDTIFQTYSLVSIPHRNHLNPHKSVSTLRGPSFFFVTETSTHPNPHCELQRRGQGSTTPFRTQCRQGPPRPTLSSQSTSEPQSRHWSGAWVCWLIVGLWLLCLMVEEEEMFSLSEYWNRVCKAQYQFKRNWFLRTRFEFIALDIFNFLKNFEEWNCLNSNKIV